MKSLYSILIKYKEFLIRGDFLGSCIGSALWRWWRRNK